MAAKIISWNARSLETCIHPAKRSSLNELITSVDPLIVSVQDCGNLAKYNHFTSFQQPIISEHPIKDRNIMTFFKQGIHYLLVENTVKSFCTYQTFKILKSDDNDTAFFFTNIYIAGGISINDAIELEHIFEKYQYERHIITGDFNAKTKTWDKLCKEPNGNGTKILKIIDKFDYLPLNNGDPTRIAECQNHTNSAIDLTLVSASFYSNDITWGTHDDVMGSDHKPQIITLKNEPIKNKFEPSMKIVYKTDIADPNIFRSYFTGDGEELKPLPTDTKDNYSELTNRIINHITHAANKGIPNNKNKIDSLKKNKGTNVISKTKSFPKTHYWFNEDCKQASKDRKYRQHRWEKTRSLDDLILYKKSKAKFKVITKKAKKLAEKQVIDSININTTAKEGWNKINKLVGKVNNKTQVKSLVPDPSMPDIIINNEKEKADVIGQQYYNISHDNNLDPNFITNRDKFIHSEEGSTLYKQQDNTNADYNREITMGELVKQLRKRKKRSAAGEDSVNYWMIKNSPHYVHQAILNLFNLIWTSGNIPQLFKTANVIPIPKVDKDLSSPASYRTIALTSHLGKLLEAIINDRLKMYLETENLLSPNQSGFRNSKETSEQVLRLEADIRKANDIGMVLCGVFLDIAKAFDTAQHCYILQNLTKYNVKGNMYNYCKDFMSNRLFSVKVGNSISDTLSQDNGVPQGAVISPTLFLISINEISKVLDKKN